MSDLQTELKTLNYVPEGRAAWLNYAQHQKLRKLFETVPLPQPADHLRMEYETLYTFLLEEAGLSQLPQHEPAVHYSAFVLMRRGYQAEEITDAEFHSLKELVAAAEQPDPDDMELHPVGHHRTLYTYLTKEMGLTVTPGRGPVWSRAKTLLDQHAAKKEHGF